MPSWAGGGEEPGPVRLSPAQPVSLVPAPDGEAGRLRVRVTDIRNPGAGALGIRATAVDPATGRRLEIGRFAVFPADRTGDYLLPISASAAAAISTPGATTEVALTADTTDDPLLSVTLIPIWE